MSIIVSEAEISDQMEIDEFLSVQPDASPYHSLSWLLSIQKAYQFKYFYFIAKLNEEITGVLPVCLFPGFPNSRRFCSLPFCDVGGAIAGSSEIANKLINHALSKLSQLRLNELELRQRKPHAIDENALIDRKVSMLMELPESAEVMLIGFKSKLRSQIKKAEKNGLVFDFSNDKKSIEDFYYVFCRNMHLLGSPTHSIEWFHALREMYQENLLVGRVWFEGKIVGAGILLFCGDNVSIPWASTLRDYNRLAPNMLLYWNLLRLSCDRGCRQFDFGRSTYGEGTYKFKKQWGAKPVLLDWETLDKQGRAVESKNSSGKPREIVEAIWKKLPLTLVNIIGPRLRRRISL